MASKEPSFQRLPPCSFEITQFISRKSFFARQLWRDWRDPSETHPSRMDNFKAREDELAEKKPCSREGRSRDPHFESRIVFTGNNSPSFQADRQRTRRSYAAILRKCFPAKRTARETKAPRCRGNFNGDSLTHIINLLWISMAWLL